MSPGFLNIRRVRGARTLEKHQCAKWGLARIFAAFAKFRACTLFAPSRIPSVFHGPTGGHGNTLARRIPPIGAKTIVQPHASAWGYFHPRNTPTLTHGANGGLAVFPTMMKMVLP
jgi:hypothetical protein